MPDKCNFGRGKMAQEPSQCGTNPLPNKLYCDLHNAEAMARVARLPAPNPYRRLRWRTGGWMISGRTTE